jgi:uncharacterized SAM-binding protein YcdF (DUF218 family)
MSKESLRNPERGGAISTIVSLLFLILLCAAVYLARHPIMRFAAESWIVNDAPANADAIVVMSDDNFYADRSTHAAELFRQGVAPVVVASGRRLRPSAGISELMQHDLIERGVPKDKIVLFPNDANGTIEQVAQIEQFAASRGWKKLLLVTSNFNTRRTRYVAQRLASGGLTVSVASAHDGDFDPEKWWEKNSSIKAFLGEIAGMLDAMWELRGAGNPAEVKP